MASLTSQGHYAQLVDKFACGAKYENEKEAKDVA